MKCPGQFGRSNVKSWKVEKCITTLVEMERCKNFLIELHVHSALDIWCLTFNRNYADLLYQSSNETPKKMKWEYLVTLFSSILNYDINEIVPCSKHDHCFDPLQRVIVCLELSILFAETAQVKLTNADTKISLFQKNRESKIRHA